MQRKWLTITYRKGKPFAAYLNLDRRAGDTAARSVPHDSGLVVDYAADGRPIGVEIPDPAATTVHMINEVLRAINVPEAAQEELAPLQAG